MNFYKTTDEWKGKSLTTKEIVNKQIGTLYDYFIKRYNEYINQIEEITINKEEDENVR